MTTTAYIQANLAHIDTTELAASIVPPEFRDVDHAMLNGIEAFSDYDGANDWDYARFAERPESV